MSITIVYLTMWWLFKKKKEDNRWDELHSTLKKSFSHIKKDITEITEKLNKKEDKHNEHLLILQRRIDRIEGAISGISKIKIEAPKTEIQEKKEPPEEVPPELWENLTNLDRSILMRASILLKENSQEWITMKYLTQELYPDKSYSSIRSLMSNYTDNLVDLGLIHKKRKGRQAYITLTKKAQSTLPKKQIKKEVKK
jgi:hypothetical protein